MEGSHPQAGFYYQNNVAAFKVLDCLLFENDVQFIHLENYEKGNHIDDVIIYRKSSVEYYQVKWSEDEAKSYTLYNLLTPPTQGKSIIKQLAEGYHRLANKKNVKIFFFTNKNESNNRRPSAGMHQGLSDLRKNFLEPLKQQSDPYESSADYATYTDILDKILAESGLDKADFSGFLRTLNFQFDQDPLLKLKNEIKLKLERLGLDESLYEKLMDAVVNWSISGEEITKHKLLKQLGVLGRFEDKLSHYFKTVEDKYYIPNGELTKKLSTALNELDGGYIFIEGAPGIGKSTALTKFKEQHEAMVVSYYCFIPDAPNNFGELRHKANYFLKSLCISIENSFPKIDFPAKYSDRYEEKLASYLETLSGANEKVVIIVDGLDHVHRDLAFQEGSLLNQIKGSLPRNIFFVLSSQYPAVLSKSVQQQISVDPRRHITVTKFTQGEIHDYLTSKGINTDGILDQVERISGGIPLYLYYISELLIDPPDGAVDTLSHLPELVDGKISTYHESLYCQIEDDEFSRWVLAVLAYRKENTEIETLHKILKNAGESKSITDVSTVIKKFSHLLKRTNTKFYAIFHNSFREFLLSKATDLKDRFNQALVEFYEQQSHSDEAYRNYFRHLFETGNFEKITEQVTLNWIKSAWSNFRTISEIQGNIGLAMQAAIENSSLAEFIRIGFLKAQFDRLEWTLGNSEIDFSMLFLGAGLEANSVRSIWDGDFVSVNKDYFSYYLGKFYRKTGRLMPVEIIKQGLSGPNKNNDAKALTRIFTAQILARTDPVALFNEIDKMQWSRSFNNPGTYEKEVLTETETRKLNFSIKSDIIDALSGYGQINELRYLSTAFPTKSKITLKINVALFELLLRPDTKEALKFLKTLDLSLLNEQLFKRTIINGSHFLSDAELLDYFPSRVLVLPTLREKLISERDARYRIDDAVISLFDDLKLVWLFTPDQFNKLFLRVSTRPFPDRNIYDFIFSLSQLWHDTRTSNLSTQQKTESLKRALAFLYGRPKEESRRVSQGLFDADTNTTFIRSDIHRLYKVFFAFACEICDGGEISLITEFWLEKEIEGRGYRHYTTPVTVSHILNESRHSKLVDVKLKVIKYAEELAREEHETTALASYLANVADAYGVCGFHEDFSRIYNQLVEVGFGVDHRKDYQASYVIDALELIHSTEPENTLYRVYEVLNTQLQLAYAGNARMLHICLSDIIRFVGARFPQLAFELLAKEEKRLGRDEAMEIVLFPMIANASKQDLPYLFAICKTISRWDVGSSSRDNHFLNLALPLLKRSIELKQDELSKSIADLVKYNITVELAVPEELNKFSEMLQENKIDPAQFQFPPVSQSLASPGHPRTTERRKFQVPVNILPAEELVELFETSNDKFNEHLDTVYISNLHNRRDNTLRNEYMRSKGYFEKYLSSFPETQAKVGSRRTSVLKAYVRFKNRILDAKSPTIKMDDLDASIKELVDDVCTIIGDQTFRQYVSEEFTLEKWKQDVLRHLNSQSAHGSSALLSDETITKIAEQTSIHRWSDAKDFIDVWASGKTRGIALLKLANRLIHLYPQEAKAIFSDASADERYGLIFPRGEDIQSLGFNPVTTILEAGPAFGRKFLLRSFLTQKSKYGYDFIANIDTLVKYQSFFDDQDISKIYYDSNLQYNRELAKGLPERQPEHEFILSHHETLPFNEIAVKYIASILNYPVVKNRELGMQSLFDLVQSDEQNLATIFKYAIAQGTSNQVEYTLVVIHAIALTTPEILLKYKSELLSLTTQKHFNILATVKEIIEEIAKVDDTFLSEGETLRIQMLNTPSRIITNQILTAAKGKRFLFSSFQVDLVSELEENETDEVPFGNNLYGALVAAGLGTMSREGENRVHRNYNINSNFDVIEINSSYHDEVTRLINEIFYSKIKQDFFDETFINAIRAKFRVCDPKNLSFKIQPKPSYVNWTPPSTSEEDFLEFNDVDALLLDFAQREEEYVTVAEIGSQWSEGLNKFSSYFEVAAFLATDAADIDSLRKRRTLPMIRHDNKIISELPTNTKMPAFPIQGVKPIMEISSNQFRGQPDNAIAFFTREMLNALTIEADSLKDIININTSFPLHAIKWQSAYSTDRRRYKPKASGFTLKIKKSALLEHLSKNDLRLYYEVYLKRSATIYHPEDDMEWYEHFSKAKATLSKH